MSSQIALYFWRIHERIHLEASPPPVDSDWLKSGGCSRHNSITQTRTQPQATIQIPSYRSTEVLWLLFNLYFFTTIEVLWTWTRSTKLLSSLRRKMWALFRKDSCSDEKTHWTREANFFSSDKETRCWRTWNCTESGGTISGWIRWMFVCGKVSWLKTDLVSFK